MRLQRLERRRDDLERALNSAPGKPSQKAVDRLRSTLGHVFRHGMPGQRKALIEGIVAEIRFEEDRLIPVFKSRKKQQSRSMTRPALENVLRGHQNTNRFLLVAGDPLPVVPIRRGGAGVA